MYHYPLLSKPDIGIFRGPGPGFGNLLFPIGRALQEAQAKNEIFVRSTIFNIKIGPINNSGKIAVHIRRGDFQKSNQSNLSHQIPTQWYLDTVDKLLCNIDLNIVIFSDSNVSDEWLKFGSRVILSQNISACSNILSMSTADFLIGSRSTFSLWSYFLSKQKSFFPKGLDLTKYISPSRNINYV